MNEEQAPKFSIMIPTRNGVRFLPYAIESVLCQHYQDFEVIVSDNWSTDGTAEYLATIVDPRLRKIRPPKSLSMTSHFEYLVSAARGTWLTVIGDDDGIMPFFFEKLEEMNLDELKADAVVFRRAYYFWGGCDEIYRNYVFQYKKSKLEQYVNNRWSIFLCLTSIINYAHIPTLYTTGLVKRAFVDRIKKASSGRLFYSTCPDVSSAAMFALHAPRHYRSEDPIFWTGTSPKSVGFAYFSATKKDRFTEFNTNNEDDSSIPKGHVPPALRPMVGAPTLFYEALMNSPGKGSIWSSRILQNFYIAGLYIGYPERPDWIRQLYPRRFFKAEMAIFLWIVKILKSYHAKREKEAEDKEGVMGFLDSHDRQAFPTIKEASAAAEALWRQSRVT